MSPKGCDKANHTAPVPIWFHVKLFLIFGIVSHKGIRLLIQDSALSLADDMQFTYARTSDFNVMRDKRYPFITLDPLSSVPVYTDNNVSNFMKTWQVEMAFYQLDNLASIQEEYALILDEMDGYVDNFINKLNFYSESQQITSNEIVITNIVQTPFIKATADILTGYLLSFRVQVNDQFNYCGLGC